MVVLVSFATQGHAEDTVFRVNCEIRTASVRLEISLTVFVALFRGDVVLELQVALEFTSCFIIWELVR